MTPMIEMPAMSPAATGTIYKPPDLGARFIQTWAATAPISIESGYWKGRTSPRPTPVAEGRKAFHCFLPAFSTATSSSTMTAPTIRPAQIIFWWVGCIFSMPVLKTSATAFQATAAGAG